MPTLGIPPNSIENQRSRDTQREGGNYLIIQLQATGQPLTVFVC